jgi:cell division protein ZapB
MTLPELLALESKIDELLLRCARLAAENRELRHKNTELSAERDTLQKKNDMARERVEAMIERLKILEEAEE